MEENVMKRKLLSFFAVSIFALTMLFGANAMAGQATNVAAAWATSTTVEENFNFGNAYSTATTNLPQQTKTAITLGTLEAYLLAATIYGF
jgi:hypothetical protein